MADPKTFKPLSDDELKDMHAELRAQFELASRMTKRWKEAGYYSEQNTSEADAMVKGYNVLAPMVTAMSSAADALMAVDRELRERQEARENQKPALRKGPLLP